jgi:septum site-determining protein MinC
MSYRLTAESLTPLKPAPRARPSTRLPLRVRGRSHTAFVLAPEPPIAAWLAELDALIQRSPAAFAGRLVVLNVSALSLSGPDLLDLVTELQARDIRIMGIEGADPSMLDKGLPPPISGGGSTSIIEFLEATPPKTTLPNTPPSEPAPVPQRLSNLQLESPVRSGQSVVFLDGDVTVIGSVASGAEIVAGGSIHVYGALRGRAIAGALGNARARIFCCKLEAELLAIDGLYKSADAMEERFRGQPVQIWLEGDAIKTATLD